ncbi:MAG: alpha/beta hydrolase [Spongiibacteraceae bacterium]|jgi:pimeloyl-ACP methyl ester carboxylesterase|nr:alpha/beta hydrolase [Spongiibacteraceae bacterium]
MQKLSSKATFVLVHGAFHGGWCWRDVSTRLIEAGHRVYAPSLTGMADRSHLLDRSVNLTTHVKDIVNLIRWEGLTNIVLCGHSYGGLVISGVAEQVPDGTIGSLAYLDAVLPAHDHSLFDYAERDGSRAMFQVDANAGLIAPPPVHALGLSDDQARQLAGKLTPQPLATFTERVQLTGAIERIPLKSYILATEFQGLPLRHEFAAAVKGRPGWRNHELACGHDVMLEIPDQLAALLLELMPA